MPACRYVKLAVERWFNDLEHIEGFYFDSSAAVKVFAFIYQFCKHYQGDLQGKPITLSDWQCFSTANIFGWKRSSDNTRRFRLVYEEVARKNGKTTKLAGIGAYLVAGDSEPGAKVYCAATKRDQAREIFDSIVMMAKQSPTLRKVMKPQRNEILSETRNSPYSKVELLAADSDTMDGLNVHGALVDELHAHRDSGVWDVLESARGARRQPLMWGITTAGKNRSSFCYEQREYAIKVLEGTVKNEAFFAIIYTLDEGDDWKDPGVWIKANPNLGISVSLSDLEEQCAKAQEMSSARIEFLMKRLNIWVYGESTWMNMERWNQCADEFDELACWDPEKASELDALPCYGGLDLASVEDLTSLAFVFVMPDGKRRFICRAYLPQEAFDQRIKKGGQLKDLYQSFVDSGYLVITPGASCDYEYIKRDIFKACERFDVKEIAFDRWNSSQLVSDCLDEEVPMVAMGQGTGGVNAPMKEMLRLTLQGLVLHCNPVLSFAMSNVVATSTPSGDIKYDKSKVSEKIDPAVASIMALGRSMVGDDNMSSEAIDDFLMEPMRI